MSDFILIAGPNGSGKSTIRDILPNPAEVVIDPDRIAREINPADPRSVDQPAAREALRRFDQALRTGRLISMETTLTGHGAVQRMRRAKAAGYDVSLVYVALASPELNVERVAARVRQGGHFIEPDLIRRRVENSLSNLPAALAIADQATVLDNSGIRHRPLLEMADRRVTFLADQLPTWLEAAMPTVAAGPATPSPRPKPPGRPLLTVLRALRPQDTAAPAPWTPPATSIGERLARYQRQAEASQASTRSGRPDQGTEAEPDQQPTPRRRPEP